MKSHLLLVIALIMGVFILAPTAAQDDAKGKACPDVTVEFRYYQDDESQGVTNVNFVWVPGVSDAVWYRLKVYNMADWGQVAEKAYKGDLGALLPVSNLNKEGDYAFILIAEDTNGNPLCLEMGTFTIPDVYRPKFEGGSSTESESGGDSFRPPPPPPHAASCPSGWRFHLGRWICPGR